MMFNGLLMCGDSDASDGTKDSAGACSAADSAAGSCDAARAHYYHNKLLSTLQILQNKEETIRVQAESLGVAEGRIAALSTRAAELRRELDRKTKEVKELHSLRKSMETCRPDKTDASVMADRQEMEDQSDVVNTLKNNLCVIEDLYRECFYETAKQESLIDLLRESYLDVRVMDKQKADHIGRLQNVINSQKCSLERCQDLAMEVDSLKVEIANFLNNSNTNNDSGMWEVRSETPAGGAQDELHAITEQLLRLREVLASGCICGLQEENMRLKKNNETLEVKIGELRHNISELESQMLSKSLADASAKQEIEMKEKQLFEIRQQLAALEEGTRDQSSACDTLTEQLQQTKALLDDKTAELSQVREQCETQETTIKELKDEVDRADHIIKEKCKIGSEVSYLTTQVSLWRAQLADSEARVRALHAELERARSHCAHIDTCYREKARSVAALQAQLEEAQARGAALCEDARAAVAHVRLCARRMRQRHREQEAIIKEKDSLLSALQQRLEESQRECQRTSISENEPSCSKCSSSRNQKVELSTSCAEEGRRRVYCGTSGSEMASCSSAPVPPRRLLRKKLISTSKHCGCRLRDARVQELVRSDASTSAGADAHASCCSQHSAQLEARPVRVRLERFPRDISPTEQLFLRVEQLSEALEDGQRRWARGRDPR